MTTQEAYQKVYEDLVHRDIGLLLGKFDAQHGSNEFMFGVQTVMELIACMSGEENYANFCEIWYKNFQKSLDKIGKI